MHIGSAAAVGNPGAATGTHHRVQSYSQAAGGHLALYLSTGECVNVRLPVRHRNEQIIAQFFLYEFSQTLACLHIRAPQKKESTGFISVGLNPARMAL